MTPPSAKAHYAQKAAKKFLRGTSFSSPDEAIRAGHRTEAQWNEFMTGEMKMFWALNGQKARWKVKARYPMRRQRKQRPRAEKGEKLEQIVTFGGKERLLAVQELEKRAEEWGQIGGSTQSRIDNQAHGAYALYLDFARHAVAGDFARWLARHSGLDHMTCRRRLLAGIALALGLTNRNQSGLLAEMRERKNQ